MWCLHIPLFSSSLCCTVAVFLLLTFHIFTFNFIIFLLKMVLSTLAATIFFALMTPNEPDATRTVRKKKCPNCHVEHHQHKFGDPGPNCQGPPSEPLKTPPLTRRSSGSPTILMDKASAPSTATNVDFQREQIRLLKLERENLVKELASSEEEKLQAEINERIAEIKTLRESRNLQLSSVTTSQSSSLPTQPPILQNASPFTAQSAAMLNPSLPPNNISTLLGNISSLLDDQQQQQHQAAPTVRPPSHLFPSVQQHQQPSASLLGFAGIPAGPADQTELFLRPTRANHITRGKALRIVDFVCRIRPSEDEKVLSQDNNCRLTLTLQDTKPKITSISVEQFNIGNLRIFYELLFSGKLSTLRDIQEYLSYAIKVLELATKYTWESVLLYDDEFRILQHTYGFSWATDHSHLHEVVLMPRWAAQLPRFYKQGHISSTSYNSESSNKGLPSNAVSHLASGSEICRLFNSRKGCQKAPCKFSHVCNRKVGSQACGKAHPGFSHSSGVEDPRQ